MTNNKFVSKNIVALLYSHSQKCFHIESLQDYLVSQINYYLRNNKTQGFQIIGVFENELLANEWTETNFNWNKQVFKDLKEKELLKLINL
jgi:hypothetical protein